MNSVVEKLDDIEATARAIVKCAQEQQAEIEKKLQNEQDRFEWEMEEKTNREIAEIQKGGQNQVNQILEEQHEKNRVILQDLENEFKENHAVYAEMILKNMIEV